MPAPEWAKKMTFPTAVYNPYGRRVGYTGRLQRHRQDTGFTDSTMQFSRHLRERVINGEITCSVRFWHSPCVMVGGRYRLDPGEVIVTSVREINFDDISESMARESGFASLDELLQTAQHGTGHHIYYIRFYFQHAKLTNDNG